MEQTTKCPEAPLEASDGIEAADAAQRAVTDEECCEGVPLSEEELAFVAQLGLSQKLRDKSSAAYLYFSLHDSLRSSMGANVCLSYLDQLLAEVDPNDAIARMLVEQIALAHHNIGRLHCQTAVAERVETAEAYNKAATRLLAEFRRMILAFKAYRNSRCQHVKETEGQATSQAAQCADTVGLQQENIGPQAELGSNGYCNGRHNGHAKSASSRRWQEESGETEGNHRSRPEEASEGRSSEPAVAAFNGSKNGRW